MPLDHGPVFVNVEGPDGRVQECIERSDPVPVEALPSAWRAAAGWLLAPVAAEVGGEWADVPSEAAHVAVGWQGLLRRLVPGRPVEPIAPRPDPLLARADLVAVSRQDVAPDIDLDSLHGLLQGGATLVVTGGERGGVVVAGGAGSLALRRYPAVRARAAVDPTGAGDVFLASLAAARIEPRLVGGRFGQGFDLLLAAAAGSLAVEAAGLRGVPDREAVRARIAEGRGLARVDPDVRARRQSRDRPAG